jgi:hypothetical protein
MVDEDGHEVAGMDRADRGVFWSSRVSSRVSSRSRRVSRSITTIASSLSRMR